MFCPYRQSTKDRFCLPITFHPESRAALRMRNFDKDFPKGPEPHSSIGQKHCSLQGGQAAWRRGMIRSGETSCKMQQGGCGNKSVGSPESEVRCPKSGERKRRMQLYLLTTARKFQILSAERTLML